MDFIRCSFIDKDGTATDKQCTKELGHKGYHSIPIELTSGKLKSITEDLARQRLLDTNAEQRRLEDLVKPIGHYHPRG